MITTCQTLLICSLCQKIIIKHVDSIDTGFVNRVVLPETELRRRDDFIHKSNIMEFFENFTKTFKNKLFRNKLGMCKH